MGSCLSFFALAALVAADEPRSPSLAALARVLAGADDVGLQRDVLNGMHEAFHGRRSVRAPAGWSAIYRKLAASPDVEVRQKVLVLSVIFDDAGAMADIRQAIANRGGDPGFRQFALQTLVAKQPADLASLLQNALDDPVLRPVALRGLAVCDDATTPLAILTRYAHLSATEKADAIATLAARPSYSFALLEAIERGAVPRGDLSAFTARQLLALKDAELAKKLESVWGTVRGPAREKIALLNHYKGVATADAMKNADRRHGRQLFAKTCATCHTLFDDGARIGPELTGSQRSNVDYILSKLLDPNAVVARDYQLTLVRTKSGRTITGIIKEESEKVLLLQTTNEQVRVGKDDIEEQTRLPQSMMPEGLLSERSDAEVLDLLAYLAGNGQVPLPKPVTGR
jgi:putative heme-binding domain-containing protein